MQDELFEWGDAKAASNWRDHGVTFEMASEVFKDPFALEWIGDSQDAQEPRYSIIGLTESRLLLSPTPCGARPIRIISASKAEPYERRRYHSDNDRA